MSTPDPAPVRPQTASAAVEPARRTLRDRLPLALRRGSFRRLTLAWFTTNIGDSALFLVLAIWVRDLTGSDSAAGMVFAALGMPALLAPLAGQLADRISRLRLLIGTNVGIGVVVLALLTVDDVADLWVIYVVAFSYGLAAYLIGAAQSGLLRDMLSDEELPAANGLFTTIDQGLRLVSPLIGTGLYVLLGAHAVVVLTAACFGLTAVVLTTIRLQESIAPPPANRQGPWLEISAGFRFLFREPTLRLLMIVLAVAWVVTGFTNVLVFPILEEGLGVGSQLLGVVVTIQSIGAVLAGAVAAAVLKVIGERRLVGAGLALMGGGLAIALSTILSPIDSGLGLVLVCAALALAGAGIPWTLVGASTYRIRATPRHLQGRTAAAMNVGLNAPQTLAMVAAAALILVMDFRILLVVAAVALLGAALGTRPWTAVLAHERPNDVGAPRGR